MEMPAGFHFSGEGTFFYLKDILNETPTNVGN